MIKILLESKDGTAAVETIARAFLNKDVSQLEYYKDRVKHWPHKTLKHHKVVGYERGSKGKDGSYSLLLDKVTKEQKARLVELCELRLQEFIDKDPWITGFRLLDKKDIPGSLATQVRAKCKGVCVACGVRAIDTPMDIDHIIPRSFGGRTELDNLQLLCYRCNRQKRNTDETDFMKYQKRLQFRNSKCLLCKPKTKKFENKLAYVAGSKKKYIIAPHSHVDSFGDLIPAEKRLCFDLVDKIREDHDKFDMLFSSNGHCSILLVPT